MRRELLTHHMPKRTKPPDDIDQALEEAKAAERLPSGEAYDTLRRIKRRYPRNSSIDIFLFQAMEKLGLHDKALEALQSAINGWESLRSDAMDRLVNAYCSNVIKDPTRDYVAEGLLAPSKFIEGGVRRRLMERLAANPQDVDALRWMGALTGGPQSVFYLRLAAAVDKQETFARRRLLKHIAERLAYSVQDLPTRWNGDFEDDMKLLDYAERLLVDLEVADPAEGAHWRPVFDRYNAVARDWRHQSKRRR